MKNQLVILAVLVVAVVGARAGGGVFAFALAGIWALVTFGRSYTCKARQEATLIQPGVMARFRYHLCASGVRYLVPVGIAMAFYVSLSTYVSLFEDSLSLDWLIAMQRAFEDVSQFFSDNLALNEVEVLAVLVGIYVSSCVLLSKREAEAEKKLPASDGVGFRIRSVAVLHRIVDLYGRYTGPVATCLATLAAFTLFGMQIGEPAKDLRLRVKAVQDGYAEVANKTEAELSQRVTAPLYRKIRVSFPPFYREALKLPAKVDSSIANVRQNANDARVEHGVSVPSVDRLLRDEAAKMTTVSELRSDLRVRATGRRRAPGGTTYNKVVAAKDALKNSHHSGEGVELIRIGAKKIILQVDALVGARIVALTRPLTDAIPILEPLLQTFAAAADKTLQERIERAYDRAMQAALRNPGDREATVERETKTVVAETPVDTLVDRAIPQARQETRRLRRALSSLTASDALIDRRLAKHKAEVSAWLRSRGLPELLPLPDFELPDLPRRMSPPPDLYRPPGMIDPEFTRPRTYVPPPRPPPRVGGRFCLIL